MKKLWKALLGGGPVFRAALQHLEERIAQVEKEFVAFVHEEEQKAHAEIRIIRNRLERTKVAALAEHVEKVFKG